MQQQVLTMNIIDTITQCLEDDMYRKVYDVLYLRNATWLGKRLYSYYDKMITDALYGGFTPTQL